MVDVLSFLLIFTLCFSSVLTASPTISFEIFVSKNDLVARSNLKPHNTVENMPEDGFSLTRIVPNRILFLYVKIRVREKPYPDILCKVFIICTYRIRNEWLQIYDWRDVKWIFFKLFLKMVYPLSYLKYCFINYQTRTWGG